MTTQKQNKEIEKENRFELIEFNTIVKDIGYDKEAFIFDKKSGEIIIKRYKGNKLI